MVARFRVGLLMVPLVFGGMLILSLLRGVECGCFGSLPFLSQISLSGHFLLLMGLFLGLYYLSALREANQETEQSENDLTTSGSLKWLGTGAITIMLAAFLPLPSPVAKNSANAFSANDLVSQAYVEAAISYQNIPIIDARSKAEFQFGHIPGAINIPYNSNDIATLVKKYALKEKPLIVYCSSARCNVAHILAQKLKKLGCQNLKIYPDGWEEWRQRIDY